MRRILASVVAAGLLLMAAACSVVDDGKVRQIDPSGGLDETLPPTIVTTTSVPEPSTSGPSSSTTPVQTEPVQLYFIASGQLVPVTVTITAPAALTVIISALQKGPPVEGFGLRTALPRDALLLVSTDNTGIASVDLPEDFFDRVSYPDQRLVIGQIVLTLTDSRGIGQVIFNRDVTKPLGEVVSAGQPLTKRDYLALSGSNPLPVDTVAAATSTSTP
jgi:spore germination protein GerM